MALGAISAMYAGATTEAMPIPSPPTMRQITRSQGEKAKPAPKEEMKNRPAPSSIVKMRPRLSAIRPAR
jgi:hypothetical protein